MVEERSTEEALDNLLPRIIGGRCTARIHSFNGKPDLLRKLPDRLRGYRYYLPDDWLIVVLVDLDADDCHELKARLDVIAADAGLVPKGRAMNGRFQVLNRIAIEELEAWFFGDVDALCAAYPQVPETLAEKAPYRDPDAIRGGTSEVLARVLGYSRRTYRKIEVARAISRHMNPERNRSHSFQVFASGLREHTCARD